MDMKRFAQVALMLLMAGAPSFAGTRDIYNMPCSALWPAVKGVTRNSGEYAVVFLDSTEMIASFALGEGKDLRIGSAVLNIQGDTCEMLVEMHSPGAITDDTYSFKKRVDKALSVSQSANPMAVPSKTGSGDK
jgi:hypothetical protein